MPNGLLTGEASTLPGFTTVNFNLDKALAILRLFEGDEYAYGLGCKPRDYSASPPVCVDYMGRYGGGVVRRIDCSGCFKYVMLHAAGVIVPDGSFTQNEWLAARSFKHDRTAGPNDPQYLTGLNPAYVYACFCKTGTRGETIGHVWIAFYHAGRWWTIESHGGKGPDSRLDSTPVLARICTDYYPIAKVA